VTDEPTDPIDPIDAAAFANLVEITGGDLEFVDELVDTYLEDARNQVDAMHAAVASGDIVSLGRAAHSLKSGSLNVGAMRLGELSRDLEEAARGGTAVPDAADRILAITAALATVGAALLRARLDRITG
jgi:HPt (histidine-containing phosphotransfer) domain-containing protein